MAAAISSSLPIFDQNCRIWLTDVLAASATFASLVVAMIARAPLYRPPP
jgi:hypothetical protein